MLATSELYERLVSKYGGRYDYWVQNVKIVADFVKKFKILPVEREHLLMDNPIPIDYPISPVQPKGKKKIPEVVRFKPRPFPGGLICPHLHLRGEIYILTDDLWRKFSSKAVKNLQDKMNSVGTVGFNQLMELSDVMGGLG